ncbi:uncharacterized protein LOC117289095 [Asterias rubens]|uniref:uncharacterized protein LOC117289095 n=1 Tax=Asterias rubens TaxID=7604 RepID=UPI0014551DBF|nr:uncharacterized protein LOC117289095 [Asterias rubens]
MNTKIVSLLALAAQISVASAQNGLLQWGIGVMVAIILGIVVGAILICVCCGCMCYHCCCKSSKTTSTVVVAAAPQQPQTHVIMHGQPGYGQQPPAYGRPQQKPYGVTY